MKRIFAALAILVFGLVGAALLCAAGVMTR